MLPLSCFWGRTNLVLQTTLIARRHCQIKFGTLGILGQLLPVIHHQVTTEILFCTQDELYVEILGIKHTIVDSPHAWSIWQNCYSPMAGSPLPVGDAAPIYAAELKAVRPDGYLYTLSCTPMQEQQQPHRQNNSSWTGGEGGKGNMWKRMRWWWVTNALMRSSLTHCTTGPTFSNHHRPTLHQNHCHNYHQPFPHFHRITLQHSLTHQVKYTFDFIKGIFYNEILSPRLLL